MKVMSVADEEISDVLHVLSGVLQLGNVNFMSAGGAQVTEKSSMTVFLSVFIKVLYDVGGHGFQLHLKQHSGLHEHLQTKVLPFLVCKCWTDFSLLEGQ